MTMKHIVGLGACVTGMFVASMALGQAIVSTGQSFVRAEFLAGEQLPDGSRLAGLRLTLRDGWKTYWRSPGEAGIPPSFDWSQSRNLKSHEMQWPRPEIFESFGMQTIGYSNEVILPIHIVPEASDEAMAVAFSAELGVCNDICVLEQVSIEATVPPGLSEDRGQAIASYRATVPGGGAEIGLVEAVCSFSGAGKDRSLAASLVFDRHLENATVLFEGADGVWFYETQTTPSDRGLTITTKLAVIDASSWIDRSSIRMTVLADDFAADIRGCSG